MTIENHMNKFLDIFGKFEDCIEERQKSEQAENQHNRIALTNRRNRIALFGIYMITHQEGE